LTIKETILCKITDAAMKEALSKEYIAVSPDYRHLAFVVKRGDKYAVVYDGTVGKEYDEIKINEPIFSPDSKRLAYIARSGNEWFAVVDGVEGKRYGMIFEDSLVFSPDSKRVGYIVRTDEKTAFAVVDGDEGPPFNAVASLGFSTDSQHVYYSGRTFDQGARGYSCVLIVDGKKSGEEYAGSDRIVFSPDWKHVAYVKATDKSVYCVVLDGVAGEIRGIIEKVVFSPDSNHLAYLVKKGGHMMVVDGVVGKEYRDIYGPFFSPDSRRVAYIGDTGEERRVVIDGAESPAYEWVWYLSFSADSSHYAYAARRDNKYIAVVDGKEEPRYTDAVFRPDSIGIVYKGGERGKGEYYVMDGMEGKHYGEVQDVAFSADSRHAAYFAETGGKIQIVCDGLESRQYDSRVRYAGRLIFDSPNKVHAMMIRGDEVLLVEIEISE
jgi:hypothetical protein